MLLEVHRGVKGKRPTSRLSRSLFAHLLLFNFRNWLFSSLRFIPLQCAKASTQRRPGLRVVTAKSTHVHVSTHMRVLIFTIVGGGETHWMQNIALLGQRVGFRALVQEWFKLSRVRSLRAFHIHFSLFIPVRSFFSKDVLWNNLLPHPESQESWKKNTSIHPHKRCVKPALLAKFSKTLSCASFFWRFETGAFMLLFSCVHMCGGVMILLPSAQTSIQREWQE